MYIMTDPATDPNIEYIVITFWDKVAIVCGAAGLFFVLLACMLCTLCPECFCPCYADEKNKKLRRDVTRAASQRSTSSRGSYGSTESDFVYGPSDVTDSGPIKWTPLDVIREQAGDWSSDASSGQDVILLDKNKKRIADLPNGVHNGDVNKHSGSSLQKGKIDFVLSYILSDEKLIVKIIEVKDLQLADGGELASPYVKIRIYRSPKAFFTFREVVRADAVISNLETEVRTRMKRPGDVMTYKESFEIALEAEALRFTTVRLLLCDMDKLSRHVTLGETSVILKKEKLHTVHELAYSKDLMTPVKEPVGRVTVGLSYLPTSEKLYLTLECLQDLKIMDKVTGATDACVKIYLMYEGKQLKRVKTTVRAASINPVFHESFSFDVPKSEIDNVYFSILVCHYHAEQRGTKNIGRVYLGTNFGSESRDLWSNMLQNPRKKIVKSFEITN